MLEKNDRIRDYTLVKFLGRGQFGEVWLAEKRLQFASRKFRHALKFLSNLENEIDLKSAEAEVDNWIAASGHPNVIPVLDMFVHQERVIIASEYAEGGSLKQWLSRPDGKLHSIEKTLKMMTGILSGIEHLHSRSVVHRDLKPDNILLQGNFPRITDFGISRIVSTVSMHTKAVGSPAYMSPESFDGIKSPQTDIWSAGVILYEMITGHLPFNSGTIFGLAAAIRQEELTPLPGDINWDLRTVVETALQKNLDIRYKTAQEMRVEIERVAYILNSRSRFQSMPGKNLIGMPEFVDPAAATEPIADYIGRASVITGGMDIADDPIKPPPADYLHATQSDLVASTSQPVGLGGPTTTQGEVGIVPAARQLPVAAHSMQRAEKGLTVLAATLAGILHILALFVLYTGITTTFSLRLNKDAMPDKPANTPVVALASKPCENVKDAPSEMVCIDGGEFIMGRDGKIQEEKPEHKETVGPFLMDKYEVTNEEYAKFVVETNRSKMPQGWKKNSYPDGEDKYPVVGVDWYDATEYATWAKKRLPTESEWEFAARGTDGRTYPWGTKWEPGFANAVGAKKRFTPVGSFKPLPPFGLYDMIGNAWEWTSSDFKMYSTGQPPNGQTSVELKTIRGHSFEGSKEYATSTYRIALPAAGGVYVMTGFRCAMNAK